MKIKLGLLFLLSGLFFLPGCNSNDKKVASPDTSPDISHGPSPESNCSTQFTNSETTRSIMVKATIMRVACRLNESDILNQLPDNM